jgi:hypothetical protein
MWLVAVDASFATVLIAGKPHEWDWRSGPATLTPVETQGYAAWQTPMSVSSAWKADGKGFWK